MVVVAVVVEIIMVMERCGCCCCCWGDGADGGGCDGAETVAGRASPSIESGWTLWLRLRAAAPSGSETASRLTSIFWERVSPAHWLTERFCEIGSRIPAIRSHAAPLAPPSAQILFPSFATASWPTPLTLCNLTGPGLQRQHYGSLLCRSPSPRSLRTALSTLLASKPAHVEGSRFHWRFQLALGAICWFCSS